MRDRDGRIKIAIAAGGTGGHISPALAVLEELAARHVPFDAIWIGSHGPFEREAAARWSIPYHGIQVGKLRRYVSLRTVTDSLKVPTGVLQARRILARERPDVVFSTGGYVGVPAVISARWLRIPSLTHEQTAVLGLATRINARFTDTIALSYPDTPHPRRRSDARVVLTGNPVRHTLRNGCANGAVERLGLEPSCPVVYVTGGAQGARAINEVISEALPALLETVQIVHQCGPDSINGDFSRLLSRRNSLPNGLAKRYVPVERVGDELRDIYAAASVVVGRSGAGTVAELATLGIPSILIPLPGATEQRANALALERAGGAVVIDQDELTADKLLNEVRELVSNRGSLVSMRAGAQELASDGAAGALVDEILRLASGNESRQ